MNTFFLVKRVGGVYFVTFWRLCFSFCIRKAAKRPARKMLTADL